MVAFIINQQVLKINYACSAEKSGNSENVALAGIGEPMERNSFFIRVNLIDGQRLQLTAIPRTKK